MVCNNAELCFCSFIISLNKLPSCPLIYRDELFIRSPEWCHCGVHFPPKTPPPPPWAHKQFANPVHPLSLQWRHNWHDGVSNHQPRECLFNRLFGRRSKKTSKLLITGLREGYSPVIGECSAQRASNAENVSIWWRHRVLCLPFDTSHCHTVHPKQYAHALYRILLWLGSNQFTHTVQDDFTRSTVELQWTTPFRVIFVNRHYKSNKNGIDQRYKHNKAHQNHDDVIKWKHFPRYLPFMRESTGHRWIPLTKASNTELWYFLWSASEQTTEQALETPVICDAIALIMTSLLWLIFFYGLHQVIDLLRW